MTRGSATRTSPSLLPATPPWRSRSSDLRRGGIRDGQRCRDATVRTAPHTLTAAARTGVRARARGGRPPSLLSSPLEKVHSLSPSVTPTPVLGGPLGASRSTLPTPTPTVEANPLADSVFTRRLESELRVGSARVPVGKTPLFFSPFCLSLFLSSSRARYTLHHPSRTYSARFRRSVAVRDNAPRSVSLHIDGPASGRRATRRSDDTPAVPVGCTERRGRRRRRRLTATPSIGSPRRHGSISSTARRVHARSCSMTAFR